MQHDPIQYVFWAVFIAIALRIVFRSLKFGGFRGGMFGAEIQSTVGEVDGKGRSLLSPKLKVHVLGNPPDKAVGLEFVTKSFASYQMQPLTLSLADAKNLIDLLRTATQGQG